MKQESKRWLSRALIVAALLGVGVLVWQVSRPTGLGEGFASGNGRIEATEVDVAAKLPGRVAEIKVDEGDFVKAGEIVARMDTQVLEAQLAQAQAQVRQAENAKLTATSLVAQRESDYQAALAVVAQRYWSDNSVSVTLSFDAKEEADAVERVLTMHAGQLKTVSFLPMGNDTYAQMPYQRVEPSVIEEAKMRLFKVDFSPIYDGDTQALEALGEQYCAGDKCIVPGM